MPRDSIWARRTGYTRGKREQVCSGVGPVTRYILEWGEGVGQIGRGIGMGRGCSEEDRPHATAAPIALTGAHPGLGCLWLGYLVKVGVVDDQECCAKVTACGRKKTVSARREPRAWCHIPSGEGWVGVVGIYRKHVWCHIP
eukprot:scaffold3288_cov115-Isochrysis_galbana.AAC.2